MKILELRANNFKRLKVVVITPGDDPVVKITGRNSQGKSSAIDAIWAALEGSTVLKSVPSPIRKGESKAEIYLDLGKYKVTRSFTHKGSYLTVTTQDGLAKINSPQKLLDSLMGDLSFDPLAFTRMGDREQSEALMTMLGVDIQGLETERQVKYDERTAVNRDLKRAKAEYEALPEVLDPPEKVNFQALMEKLKTAVDENRQHESLEFDLEHAPEKLKEAQDRLETAEKAVALWTNKLKEAKAAVLVSKPPDLKSIQAEITEAEATNQKADQAETRAAAVTRWQEINVRSASLSGDIDGIVELKAKRLADADMPVPGLEINPETTMLEYNGIPLKQSSKSEQLRVATFIAMAMNPELRIMRIEDGSLLDDESMEILSSMATDKDYQLWIEIVDTSGEVGIHIEDGEIVEGKPTG